MFAAIPIYVVELHLNAKAIQIHTVDSCREDHAVRGCHSGTIPAPPAGSAPGSQARVVNAQVDSKLLIRTLD